MDSCRPVQCDNRGNRVLFRHVPRDGPGLIGEDRHFFLQLKKLFLQVNLFIHDGIGRHGRVFRIPHTPFLYVGEKGGKGIEVFSCKGIVFVVVTFGATHGGAEKDGGCVANTVGGILCHVFLGLGPSLARCLVHPIETRCNEPASFLKRIALEQVARQLLDHELVVGFVFVEGPNQVIAVEPTISKTVLLVTHGISIAGKIQPRQGEPFTEVRRGEEFVDQLGVCLN